MAHGLVLTGELRRVKLVHIRPDEGDWFDQWQIVIDTGADYLQRVVVRRGDEELAALLQGHEGEHVSLEVSVGNFRKLWLERVLS